MSDSQPSDTPPGPSPRKGNGHLSAASWLRAAIGFAAVFMWLALFTSGFSIGTTSFMHSLDPDDPHNQPPTWDQRIKFLRFQEQKLLPVIDEKALTRADYDEILRSASDNAVTHLTSAAEDKRLPGTSDAHTVQTVRRPITTTASEPNSKQVSAPSPLDGLSGQSDNATKGADLKPSLESSQASEASRANTTSSHSVLFDWFGVFLCNTIVNLGLLSCLASLVGGLYYAILHPATELPERYGPEWYLMSMVQGFVMYLAVLAGLLIIGEVPVENVTTTKYVHLAGFISVLSFWAGFTPDEFFLSIIGRAVNRATAQESQE